jgi:hypothetical protein
MWFWKQKIRLVFSITLLIGCLFMNASLTAVEPDYSKIIQAIAQDIAGLKTEFKQLKMFSPATCADLERLTISYGYSTHQPQHRAGWRAGVPNPNEDGVWFYIDLHDPNSQAQIHTQPVTMPLCFGDKRVSFLILEGKKTKSVGGRIGAILRKHGIKTCNNS